MIKVNFTISSMIKDCQNDNFMYMTKSVSHGGHKSIPEHIKYCKDCQRWSGNIKDVQRMKLLEIIA